MFDHRLAGQPPPGAGGAMTTGTVLAFSFTGNIVPLAIVSGIWLEARLPAPQPPHAGPPGHPRLPGPVGLQAGGDQAGPPKRPPGCAAGTPLNRVLWCGT